jgi:uncharacterized protein YgiM (DUF1202 family)
MTRRSIATILAAVSLTALAAPALAETSPCVVKAPEINLRKSPSKKAGIIAVLKKDTKVTAQACAGGWVKVSSADGRRVGYVGGWALAPESTKTASAALTPPVPVAPMVPVVSASSAPSLPIMPVVAAINPEVARHEAGPLIRDVPSNEKLAYQITELRLNVLGIERDMDRMGKDITKIKQVLRRNTVSAKASHSKKAAQNKKAHRLIAKR